MYSTLKLGFIVPVLAVSLSLTSVRAQTEPVSAPTSNIAAKTPEAIAEEYIRATNKNDYAAMGRLMHPDELETLRKIFRPHIASQKGKQIGINYLQVKSLAEFDKLAGWQLFERFMRGIATQSPEMNSILAKSQYKVIGHTLEAPDKAHVVYRMILKIGDMSTEKVAVISLRQNQDQWGALFDGDIQNLKRGLEMETAANQSSSPPAKKPAIKPKPKPK